MCVYIAIIAVARGQCTGLKMQWLQVGILAGRAFRERQCTLEGETWYVNVWGSAHWKGVHRVGEWTLWV